MAHWLTVQVARLLAHQGASTCIMTGTIVGAAIGAAALSPTPTPSAPRVPTAIATPAVPAAPAPCMRFVGDDERGCGAWFHHRGHHFGQFGHGRYGGTWGDGDDWGSGFWPGQAQPTPLAPDSPNGGTINAPVTTVQGFGM
jgi:hypothetical protein